MQKKEWGEKEAAPSTIFEFGGFRFLRKLQYNKEWRQMSELRKKLKKEEKPKKGKGRKEKKDSRPPDSKKTNL